MGVGRRRISADSGSVVCIESTHNVLTAKRMHFCHTCAAGGFLNWHELATTLAVYILTLPGVKLACCLDCAAALRV